MYQILIGVLTVLILISLYIYFRRKKYTRERFIFFSTLMIFSFAATVLTHIFADKSVVRLVAEVYNFLPVESISIQATSWSDKLWSVFVFVILVVFISLIINGWDGAKSKFDLQQELQKRDLKLYQSFIKGGSFRRIEQYFEEDFDSIKQNDQRLDYLDEDLDWHTEVKEILKMSSKQFKILESDWHSKNGIYISKYYGKKIVVICPTQDIDMEAITNKLIYVKSLDNSAIFKVLVCVKHYKADNARLRNNPISDVELEYTYKVDLLEGLVDFDEYYEYINTQFDNTEILEGDGVCIKDIYVSSSGKKTDFTHKKDSDINDVGDYLLSWVKSKTYEKQISLLGDYGQGKSVLSLWLARTMINGGCDRIPVIIELRGKSPRNETLPSIISSWAIRFHIDPMAIQKLLQEGRLLIILEGFDELDMIGDSNRRLEHFKKLWEFARYRKSKIIITGRPNLFLNNEEIKNYLHVDSNSFNLFYSEAIMLSPFSTKQIEEGLRNTDPRVKNEMLEVLSDSGANKSFLDLISRPSTLYQASVIWDDLDKSSLNSASVIQEFIRHAYKRQEEKLRGIGKTGIEPPVLTGKEREFFMAGIAVGMVKRNGYSNQINRADLEVIISRLYFEIPEDVSSDHIGSKTLKVRMKDNKEVFQSISNDIRASGILVRDLTTTDSFKFAHKSFLEFLVAQFFVEYVVNKENVSNNCIYRASGIESVYTLKYSSEVVYHISNLILSHGNVRLGRDNPCRNMLKIIEPKLTIIDSIFFKKLIVKSTAYKIFIYISLIFSVIYLAYFIGDSGSFTSAYLLSQIILMVLVSTRLVLLILTKKYRNALNILTSCCNAISGEDGISSVISEEMTDHFTQYEGIYLDNPSYRMALYETIRLLIGSKSKK